MDKSAASTQVDLSQASTPAMNEIPTSHVERVDTSYLETLLGYNARRSALKIIALFLERMAPHGLRPVDFSVLSLITHNPGITSRQLCATLAILPPNLVGMIGSLEKRDLVQRRPHPHDGRAQGIYLTAHGQTVMTDAETLATNLELEVTDKLTPAERKTLTRLLQKIYL
jgi:DNA-binding MarR family transcriptional regulator